MRARLLRSLSAAAAAALAMFLALVMVVVTPSTSHALVETVKPPPTVLGSVKTIAPKVLMGAVRLHPAGFLISNVATLGMMAYEEREHWLPYVTGTLGQLKDDTDVPAGGSSPIDPLVSLTAGSIKAHPSAAHGLLATVAVQRPASSVTGDQFYSVYYQLKCRMGDGTNRTYLTGVKSSGNSYTYQNTPHNSNFGFFCASGETPLGLVVGPANSAPELQFSGTPGKGPKNLLRWGDLLQGEAWDARSADTVYTFKSECVTADGGTVWIEKTTPGNYGALEVPSCKAAGFANGTGKSVVEVLAPGTTVPEKVWETDRPDFAATPMCDPAKGGSGCTLTVEVDGSPCEVGRLDCEQWAEINQSQPERVKCKLGPYETDKSNCNLLERAFIPGGAPGTEANTDGDPATRNNNDPNGKPIPQPSSPATGTSTGTAPVPGGAGQTSASADAKTRQCFPTGWAVFNPVEWVVKPIRCAFEPSDPVQNRAKTLGANIGGMPPVAWLDPAMTGPKNSGCPDWVVTIPGGTSTNVVCDSSFTAAIVGARGPIFGLVAGAMVWPLIRSLWYSAIPIMRAQPSK